MDTERQHRNQKKQWEPWQNEQQIKHTNSDDGNDNPFGGHEDHTDATCGDRCLRRRRQIDGNSTVCRFAVTPPSDAAIATLRFRLAAFHGAAPSYP